MVHIVNLGVGLILAGVLVVAFCKRHKWTNGKSIVEHLLKWRKRADHETETSSLEEGTGKNYVVKVKEGESDNLGVEDETKRAQHDGFLAKGLDANNCKEQEIVEHAELLEAGQSM